MTENTNDKPRALGLFSKSIIVTTILFVILGPLGLMEFLIGLLSPSFTPIIPFFIYIASYFLVIIAIVAFFASWNKYIKNIICVWLMRFGVIFLFLVIFLIPPRAAFLHGFKLRVKRLADTSEIRNWLGSLEEGELNGGMIYTDPNSIEDYDWPTSLKNLSFWRLVLDKDENGKPILFAVDSGYVNEWGFVIGDPNMENVHPWTEGNFILPVEEGVYVWHGRFGYWGDYD